jgi:hypothetical protein
MSSLARLRVLVFLFLLLLLLLRVCGAMHSCRRRHSLGCLLLAAVVARPFPHAACQRLRGSAVPPLSIKPLVTR